MPSMASVPIIVVTGDSLPTHHEMARSRGAVAVLSKPIVPGELLTVVRDALVRALAPLATAALANSVSPGIISMLR